MDLIRRILNFFGYYPQPDLTPGPWFRGYVEAWAKWRGLPLGDIRFYLTSGIVEGRNGKWIWATETVEFDQWWFESQGFSFPKRWLPFSALRGVEGEPGQYVKLDV